MPMPVAASQLVHLGAVIGPLAVGLLVAAIGHLFRSRWLILTGLVILALVFVLFSFVIRPGS